MAYPNHDPYSGIKVVANGRNTGQPPADGLTSATENLVYDEDTTHKVNKYVLNMAVMEPYIMAYCYQFMTIDLNDVGTLHVYLFHDYEYGAVV